MYEHDKILNKMARKYQVKDIKTDAKKFESTSFYSANIKNDLDNTRFLPVIMK